MDFAKIDGAVSKWKRRDDRADYETTKKGAWSSRFGDSQRGILYSSETGNTDNLHHSPTADPKVGWMTAKMRRE